MFYRSLNDRPFSRNRPGLTGGSLAGFLRVLLAILVSGIVFCANAQQDESENGDDIRILVAKQEETVIVDASYSVPVSPRTAWEVLTDYEHMADFIPEVQTSKVLERRKNKLRVFQSGRVFFGPIPIGFDYLREIDLLPFREIRSRVLGGSLKSGEVTTQLVQQDNGTLIVYHSEAVPDIWLPLGIGEAFIRNSIRKQFVTMQREMMRRKSIELRGEAGGSG